MAKKSKRNISETVVNSILDDLQKENSSPSTPLALVDSNPAIELADVAESTSAQNLQESEDQTQSLQEDLKSQFDPDRTAVQSSGSEFNHVHSNRQSHRSDDSKSDVVIHHFEDTSRTQPAANIEIKLDSGDEDLKTKISYGYSRPLTKSSSSMAASVTEANLIQSENLRLAQNRLLELEKEVEDLRQENELLASAGDLARQKNDELLSKVQELEKSKVEELQQFQMEMNIYRENLVEKDKELGRLKQKSTELESRLAKDFKKIRVRERELENRLELIKVEKQALLRAKDDSILDLKNKIENLSTELENYKNKAMELGDKLSDQNDQLTRTVRALRLALTHLEAHDTGASLSPLKKAE